MELNKRVLSCAIVFLLLMGIRWYSFQTFWNSSEEAGEEGDKEDTEKKEEQERFLIYSREDWITFCQRVNGGEKELNGVLEKDIDLEGEIYWVLHYEGHFDGQGYTISNTGRSLFNLLGEKAVVENVAVQDANIRLEKQHRNIGAIASRSAGLIKNCQADGYIEGAYFVGGIVGFNEGKIEDCINHAEIRSTATGEVRNWWEEYTWAIYGAGGIAGFCGTKEKDRYDGVVSSTKGCINYGRVTAETTAGGICGILMGGYEFSYRNIDLEELDIVDCKNYGTITSMNIEYGTEYPFFTFGYVGGICGKDMGAGFFHCANLGKVQYHESVVKTSRYGDIHDFYPHGITNGDRTWNVDAMVIDCVSLQGTVEENMRGEMIMEITMEELPLWEEGLLPYEINSWQFDLEEAVFYEGLEPLGIEENEASKEKKNYYLSEEFILALPEGFSIEEKRLEGELYALHIQYEGEGDWGKEQENTWREYETWILRKDIDMESVLVDTLSGLPWHSETESEVFMEYLGWELPELLQIPFYDSVENEDIYDPIQRQYSENRIVVEDSILDGEWDAGKEASSKALGNIRSMVLEGNPQEGIKGRWILLHSHKDSSSYPPRDYVDAVNEGFYPLSKGDRFVQVEKGDTLWSLAFRYMGKGEKAELLAKLNQLENPNQLMVGECLLLPDGEAWGKRPAAIEDSWFTEENGCVAEDTGRERMTVYLEPEEVSLEELGDLRAFDGKEVVLTLAAALEEGTVEETLQKLNQPAREITSQEERQEWARRDDSTWYLKCFVEETEGKNQKWFFSQDDEQVYGQIVVQDLDSCSDWVNYFIFTELERDDGTVYVNPPILAAADSQEHYFLKSKGEYGQNDLWVVIRNEEGEIEGLAGYFYQDRQVIYLEMKNELRITRRYIRWDYLPRQERGLLIHG